MSATYLALHTPTAPTTLPRRAAAAAAKSCFIGYNNNTSYTSRRKNTGRCKASASSSSSITELDLYDLLGIESSSSQSQIKVAYRSLQKRCHPDIAGPTGHDMSIILNEVYALLSDPTSRAAYDKEQAKLSDVRGYTGRPLYSVWVGSEKEERAVFVDEVKCVGCLKCALLAGNTFAIESSYGRARVVAQWADPEPKIQEAIDSCPVDCISMVGRSDLAALEFLMSKQPRGATGAGGNTVVGSNIYADLNKFQTKVEEAALKQGQGRGDYYYDVAKMSAINTIRSISNWLYWDSPIGVGGSLTRQSQTQPPPADHPTMKKLRDAAAARRTLKQLPLLAAPTSDYWPLPTTTNDSGPVPPTTTTTPPATSSVPKPPNTQSGRANYSRNREFSPIRSGIPLIMAAIAVAVVKFNSVSAEAVGGGGALEDHIGGSLALQIVNSSWLQIALAGATWFYIGMALVELIAVTGTTTDDTK